MTRVLTLQDEIPNGSLAERAGIPELGWIPELVVTLVILSTSGMVAGAFTVTQAALILAFSGLVTFVHFARIEPLRSVEAPARPQSPPCEDEAVERRAA